MVVSTRAVLVVGLVLVGVTSLVGPSLGQQPDSGVRKAATQAATSKPTAPATFGTIDMGAVFKGYDKVKSSSEEFKAAAMARKNGLVKHMTEAQQESELLAKMTPGSPDFKKHEDRITELKAKYEAEREQAEREFSMREAEMLATLYKEIQSMVSRVAEAKALTYVMRVSSDPISGQNPNSVMAAIDRTVVYADPRSDITGYVVYNLNLEYHQKNPGSAPKAATAPAAAGAATRPVGVK